MRPSPGAVLSASKVSRASWQVRATEAFTPVAESSLQARLRERQIVSPDPTVRLRFAPSPTGRLHLGGLRTALINRMMAKKWGGQWLLRIEDTDRSRYQADAVDGIRRDLEWAGLEYDEGLGVGGSYGPYVQSDRRDLYLEHAKILLDQGKAYECFCTKNEIWENYKIKHAELVKQGGGRPTGYDGRCRHLTEEERARRKKAGEEYSIRFKSPGHLTELPDDLVFGSIVPQRYAGNDDFVLVKQDGWPTYHLASVVDDHHMKISHVIRGEEWIASMSKHTHLYQAFGWTPPSFAHLALLANPDGTKLSKRQGSVAVESYREEGYEPEALLNFVGLIGWDLSIMTPVTAPVPPWQSQGVPLPVQDWSAQPTPDYMNIALGRSSSFTSTGGQVLSLDELTQVFSLDKLTKRKGVVDLSRLTWVNKATMRRMAWLLDEQRHIVQEDLLSDQAEAKEINMGRQKAIERFVQLLKERYPSLEKEPLLDDDSYVWDVLVLEIPRVDFFHELHTSAFFFQDPDWSSPDAVHWLGQIDLDTFVRTMDLVIEVFEAHLPEERPDTPLEERDIHPVMEKLVAEGYGKSGLWKTRRGLLPPLRLALTAQRQGPTVAEIIRVLGRSRTLERLQQAREHAKSVEMPETARQSALRYQREVLMPQRQAEQEEIQEKVENKLARRLAWEMEARKRAAESGAAQA